MSPRTIDEGSGQPAVPPANDSDDSDIEERKWLKEFSGPNQSRALVRFIANQIFHVSRFDGVDVLAARARAVFDAIPPSALAVSPETSSREVFYKAVTMWANIIQLAVIGGRSDLEHLGNALFEGLVALEDREMGFDEPLLRARKRSRHQPRDPFYVRQLKVLSSNACSRLKKYGMKDAAIQVAKIVNEKSVLPPKRSGKLVVDRSVRNWNARQTKYNRWLFRPEMDMFREAAQLWREGRPGAARQAVIRELSDRLQELRRFAWTET
jgi:hypothetical protein